MKKAAIAFYGLALVIAVVYLLIKYIPDKPEEIALPSAASSAEPTAAPAETAAPTPTSEPENLDFDPNDYLDKNYIIIFNNELYSGYRLSITTYGEEDGPDYYKITTDSNEYYCQDFIYLRDEDMDKNIKQMVIEGYDYSGTLINRDVYTNIFFYTSSSQSTAGILESAGSIEYLIAGGEPQKSDIERIADIAMMQNVKVMRFYGLSALVDISSFSDLPKLVALYTSLFDGTIPVMKHMRKLSIGIMMDGINDTSAFRQMEHLQSLYISNFNVENLDDFANLKELKYLTIVFFGGLTDISAISKMESLESLTLSSNWSLEDISPIANAPSLKELALLDSHNLDINTLGQCEKLDTLYIRMDGDNADFLSGLTGLQHLYIDGDWDDISAIGQLQQLESLSLSGRYSGAEALANLTSLRELELAIFQNMSMDFVQSMPNLEKLKISVNSLLTSVDSVAELKNLKELYLPRVWNELDDVSFLEDFHQLEILQLNVKNISDISPIASLDTLKVLHLTNVQIGHQLPQMPNLQNMGVSSLDITDLQILANQTNLRKLYLSYCRNVTDTSAISNLVNLEYLYLDDLQLSEIPGMKKLINLKGIKIVGDLYDIPMLEGIANAENLEFIMIDGNYENIDLGFAADMPNIKCITVEKVKVADHEALLGQIDNLYIYPPYTYWP